MIESIEIKNFQGHTNSKLNLSPGVNIISGQSNAGKSSIIRALKWNILNRPRGDSFKSNTAKKKDVILVDITLADSNVTRKKDGTFNGYTIKKESYQALRSDVPEEIKNVLQIDEINIQSQHDGYFLLQDSPGEVAKKLNNIAGLSIIDSALAKVNAIIRETKAEHARTSIVASKLISTIKEYKKYKQYSKTISALEKKATKISELDMSILNLAPLLRDIDIVKKSMKSTQKWLAVKEKAQLLQEKADALVRNRMAVSSLSSILNTIVEYETKIKNSLVLEKKEQVTKLLEKAEDIKLKHCAIDALRILIQDIANVEKRIEKSATSLDKKKKEYDALMTKHKVCPLCNAPYKRRHK